MGGQVDMRCPLCNCEEADLIKAEDNDYMFICHGCRCVISIPSSYTIDEVLLLVTDSPHEYTQ